MKLFNHLIENFNVKNDAELSRKLEVSPPVISRIRNGKCNVSAEIIVRVHEIFEIPIKDIKAML